MVLLILVIWLARRQRRIEARLTAITRGVDGRSLESVLDAHLDKVFEVARGLDDVTTRTEVLEREGRHAFQRVGLVRYNPFEETGGNQSFALALLDADGNGWVLSSLHARSGDAHLREVDRRRPVRRGVVGRGEFRHPSGHRLTPKVSRSSVMVGTWPPSIRPSRRSRRRP